MVWPVVGAVAGALISSRSNKSAAKTSADASTYAAELADKRFKTTRKDLMPYMSAGKNALGFLSDYGPSRVDDAMMTEYNPVDLSLDPGYQFRLDEQNAAINSNMAGMGKFLSGNRLDEIIKRSGQMASDEYGRADQRNRADYSLMYGREIDDYNRAYGREADFLNRLFSLAGIGQNAAVQSGNAGAQAANTAGAATMQGANTMAAAQMGNANIFGNLTGDLLSYYQAQNNPYQRNYAQP